MARRSVLNRSFSTSEKVLMLVLAVLLVVACYYFLVVKNVADTIAANEDRLADIEISITNRNTQNERTVRYREIWRWDDKAGRWWQTTGLPDFWNGQ